MNVEGFLDPGIPYLNTTPNPILSVYWGGTTASVYVVQWIEATQVSGTHPVRSRLPTLVRFTPALFVPRFRLNARMLVTRGKGGILSLNPR